jgi:hypothetical protein
MGRLAVRASVINSKELLAIDKHSLVRFHMVFPVEIIQCFLHIWYSNPHNLGEKTKIKEFADFGVPRL